MKRTLSFGILAGSLSLALLSAASAQPRLGPPPAAAPAQTPGPAPAPAPAPAAPAAGGEGDLGPVVGDGKIVLQPPTIRVGQKTTAQFQDFPDAGSLDQIVVVKAGAPDSVGNGKGGETPLTKNTLNKFYLERGWEIGPFAPGIYEIRWLTELYNNDHRLEVGARARLTVTR